MVTESENGYFPASIITFNPLAMNGTVQSPVTWRVSKGCILLFLVSLTILLTVAVGFWSFTWAAFAAKRVDIWCFSPSDWGFLNPLWSQALRLDQYGLYLTEMGLIDNKDYWERLKIDNPCRTWKCRINSILPLHTQSKKLTLHHGFNI